MNGQLQTQFDPSMLELRKRSTALAVDPKAKELKHFIESHSHQERLKVNVKQEVTSNEQSSASFAEGPTDATQQEGINCSARLQWREEMDRKVKRLMQDVDLPLSNPLEDADKARLRCNHLDKTFAWFEQHGRKEATKERPPPAFLRFDNQSPAMPGSLRSYRHSPAATMSSMASTTSENRRNIPAEKPLFSPTLLTAASQNLLSSKGKTVSVPPGQLSMEMRAYSSHVRKLG
eukprot:TRINITY_DN35791_c0_g1_i1.p1 TRINITY_DN35791_c0_g1~~TRINITY_DN35791_c0_g1_i1.p1  ORF type:complete len:233 (-),score=51.62 TRINITY_DN35791_c0_g1_i1:47-745(-)